MYDSQSTQALLSYIRNFQGKNIIYLMGLGPTWSQFW